MTSKYSLFFFILWTLQLFGQDTLIIKVDRPSGYYTKSVQIALTAEPADSKIFYTLDGSTPSMGSQRYFQSITIDSTRVLRAVAYANNKKSEVYTGTYLVNEDSIDLPVLSLSIEPYVLFHPATGLFNKGYNASPNYPYNGANYYSRKEYQCHVELFEEDRRSVLSNYFGFKLFGGMSRIFPQKSFSLYASNRKYGVKHIKHRLFPQKNQKKYKRLVLRNSGSDFGETHFRDAFITSMGKTMGLEVQAYRPSVVFINGEYWGIYNFREKLTRHYIAENFGLHKDSIHLIEHRKSVQAGSRQSYDKMQKYMLMNDLSIQEHFDYINTQMDIDNFMEYEILQIYIDNQDAGGNIKFWRPMHEGGRWRWILFDTDFGMGHYGRNGFKNNSLAFHTAPNGPGWPNPPWSTFNLRHLLKNKGFQSRFVSRFLDRLNYTFDSTRVIPGIDSFANRIQTQLPRHLKRWNLTMKRWQKEVDRMKEFCKLRPTFMRSFLMEMFPQFGKEAKLEVKIDSGGYVQLNQLIDVYHHFSGIYFDRLPVQLHAFPNYGSMFSHWELNGDSKKGRVIQLELPASENTLKAIFIDSINPVSAQLIINELGIHDSLCGDWIELYNPSDQDLDLSNFLLVKNAEKIQILPELILPAKDFVILAKHTQKLKKQFPAISAAIIDLELSLGNHATLMIFDTQYTPVDSISYDLDTINIDSVFTHLSLMSFEFDNADFSNWERNIYRSSPGEVNPKYLQIKKEKEWQLFMQQLKIGLSATLAFVALVFLILRLRKKKNKFRQT